MADNLQTDLSKANYSRIVRCGDCNAVIKILSLQKGQRAVCPRCHNVLYSTNRWSLKRCSIIDTNALCTHLPAVEHSPAR